MITKEQKVSEFRQAWIDELRTEISGLIAHANAILSATNFALANLSTDGTWVQLRPDYVEINKLSTRIELRLNVKEPVAKELLTCMAQIDTYLAPSSIRHTSFAMLDLVEKELVRHGKELLKTEWKRVRDGERFYRVMRISLVALIIVGVLGLAEAWIAQGGVSSTASHEQVELRASASTSTVKLK